MEEKKNDVQPQSEAAQASKGALMKYVLAVVMVGLGLLAVFGWWKDLMTLFKGAIGIILVLAGVITFAIAKE